MKGFIPKIHPTGTIPRFFQSRKALAVICVLLSLSPLYIFAQQYPREEVLASYIFNFAKNTEWPNESSMDEFHFVVMSKNDNIYKELHKISLKKTIRNKPVKIFRDLQSTSLDKVQLIFVAKNKESEYIKLFDKTEGKNILLVTDKFDNKKIVMINFYETVDHKLRFEINKANIINQGLSILPEMVLLGGTEIDVAELYRQSLVSLRSLQKKVEALQQHQEELEDQIETSRLTVLKQQSAINTQSASIDSQKIQLAIQKQELNQLLANTRKKQDTLNEQTLIILQQRNELSDQKKEITRRENILITQQSKIDKLNAEIQTQTKTLKKRNTTISTQKKILYLLVTISFLGMGLVFSIYRGYANKKKTNARLTKEIEDRKKVEEALGKIEDLYHNAPCGYHSLDKNGVIVGINNTELKWIGYKQEEIVGKKRFSELLTEDSLQLFKDNFPMFKTTGKLHDLEFDMVRKDGSILPVLLSATAVLDKDGSFLMSRSNIYDITARKKAEQEIRKLNAELEKRIEERTAQLEASNKELQAFAYSVSHDLRAPLRSIDGFSQVLLEEYHEKLGEAGEDYLNRLRAAAQRMAQLIDDMLNLSRISRDAMHVGTVDLSNIVRKLVHELRESQPKHEVECMIQDGIIVKGDARLLRVALENLLNNAWKFTSKHQSACIEFGMLRQHEMDVYFVKDDGAGFDMNYANKLFGAFQRLHSTGEFPGTGIGLATVQRIVHRHGGQIWAEGEVEKGATFYFTLS